MTKQYLQILKSYVSERYFRIREEDSFSDLREISAGVPQGSVYDQVLYLLYTCNITVLEHNNVDTFADDTAIEAVGMTSKKATKNIQIAGNQIHTWIKK